MQLVRPLLFISLAVLLGLSASAQEVRQRVIMIGDAGEQSDKQKIVIREAANRVLQNKTSVLFLGDNVYPRGMGLEGSVEENETKKILQSQFGPMREKDAAVYFIPGNHDWDASGLDGLEKIKALSKYINLQNDPKLQVTPAFGCPDPHEISFSDNLTIIAFDSEWWLFPFEKINNEADCLCKTKSDVIAALNELVYKNRNKVILLASHHPFKSYGHHGSYFNFKDHLFPLTEVNDHLWIPLPVIGSLYPFLRSTFPSPEDAHHPLFRDMTKKVNAGFKIAPNTIFVGGHDHTLQLIKRDSIPMQIIAGSGSKHDFVRKKKPLLFGQGTEGFVVADLLQNNDLQLIFFEVSDEGAKEVYRYTKKYELPKAVEQKIQPVQGDSVTLAVHPSYDSKGKLHRVVFGENYRKEYATPVTLPVIRISTWKGGLKPEKLGGGKQTSSLRLKDKTGKEWVLRTLEKNTDKIIPDEFQNSFVQDILNDAMSSEHPFAPLIVPVLAQAAQVYHANPVIGLVAPEKELGHYLKLFGNQICLLEQREPLGDTDNTPKMLKKLYDDNDNNYDADAFLRARLLDLLISDWDRHPDQWRWRDTVKGSQKKYLSIPRDRDQALYKNEGIFPAMVARPWARPLLQGFEARIPHVNYSMKNSNFMNQQLANQFSHDEWMAITDSFVKSMTDSVIDAAVKRLPEKIWELRHEELSSTLRKRRDNIPNAMEDYYKFSNRVVDIKATNKNEFVEIRDTLNNDLKVTVYKLAKGKRQEKLMSNVYEASVTKAINVYLSKGDDELVLNNNSSPIRLRVVGGKGKKKYEVQKSKKKVDVYERPGAEYAGQTNKLKKHIKDDSVTTGFTQYNLYNYAKPLITAKINLDDGFVLGVGLKYFQHGFRKAPYQSMHKLMFNKSFNTGAFRIVYGGTWYDAIGRTDILLDAAIKAPNTQNFFGRGNETEAIQDTDHWARYYRVRFNLYELNPALRWKNYKGMELRAGPSLQYYTYDHAENEGRFIEDTQYIGSYDSATIDQSKLHAGAAITFINDRRNSTIFPAWGTYVNVKVAGYEGLNRYSESYIQITPEVVLYKSITSNTAIVLADRIGGGFTLGKTAFYQSVFLGSHENFNGFRQYRFAGQHGLYNNLELRIRLATLTGYYFPGEFGVTPFYDVGRVWEKGENSNTWHHSTGAGLYFAPARLIVFQVVAGYSQDGWYPSFDMRFRY